jgi:hypothetical protein
MRRELLLQGYDDPPRVGTGARATAGNKDHAVISWAAGRDRLVMKRPHIDEVVGNDYSPLIACELDDTTVIE